jgi:hypothetical protein
VGFPERTLADREHPFPRLGDDGRRLEEHAKGSTVIAFLPAPSSALRRAGSASAGPPTGKVVSASTRHVKTSLRYAPTHTDQARVRVRPRAANDLTVAVEDDVREPTGVELPGIPGNRLHVIRIATKPASSPPDTLAL